jgi:hypothetical protein
MFMVKARRPLHSCQFLDTENLICYVLDLPEGSAEVFLGFYLSRGYRWPGAIDIANTNTPFDYHVEHLKNTLNILSQPVNFQHRMSENRLMNCRLAVWVVSIFTCVALAGSAVAQALPAGGASSGASAAASGAAAAPTIPPAAETASDATQYAPAIRAFIAYELKILSGSDSVAATAARDAVRKTLTRGSTPSYYGVFCREWSTACTAALVKNPPSPLGMRLNIAILTNVLTDNGQTMDPSALSSAESLVDLLLGDSAASVSIWGVKSARPLVMLRMQLPDTGAGKHAVDATPMVADIVAAVRKHQKSELSGFITEDAYSTLAIKEIPGLTDDKVKAMQPPLVEPILDILALRVGQYKDGAIPCPGAERTISTFLSGQYKVVQLSTQKRMVQLLVNLEVYSGQRADQYINHKANLAQLRDMLKYVTSSIKVIANDKTVDTSLSWLEAIPPSATPPEIAAHTVLVPGAVKPVFSWLVNPPAIPVMDPPPLTKVDAPAPATPPK